MRADVEKYVQDCDICISSKTLRHKPYGSIQALPISTHKWKDLSKNFVTWLPTSKAWRSVEYHSIYAIIDRLTKIVYYKPILTT